MRGGREQDFRQQGRRWHAIAGNRRCGYFGIDRGFLHGFLRGFFSGFLGRLDRHRGFALSLDRRHFGVVRPSHTKVLTLIP